MSHTERPAALPSLQKAVSRTREGRSHQNKPSVSLKACSKGQPGATQSCRGATKPESAPGRKTAAIRRSAPPKESGALAESDQKGSTAAKVLPTLQSQAAVQQRNLPSATRRFSPEDSCTPAMVDDDVLLEDEVDLDCSEAIPEHGSTTATGHRQNGLKDCDIDWSKPSLPTAKPASKCRTAEEKCRDEKGDDRLIHI